MEQKIFFTNSKGNKLCGILTTPSERKDIRVIVMAHGFSSNKDSGTYTRLTEIFNKQNIATFRFDFFGHGESDGDFAEITVSEAVEDVLQAIKYVKSVGFTKIGLVGASFGGIASIMAAAKSHDLYVLALKCPVSNFFEKLMMSDSDEDLETWKRNGFKIYKGAYGEHKLNYTFYTDSEKNNGYEVAPNIKVPTLIIHGDQDKSVPVEQSKKTAQLIPECKLVIIPGADHRFTNEKDFEKMIQEIADFIITTSRQ